MQWQHTSLIATRIEAVAGVSSPGDKYVPTFGETARNDGSASDRIKAALFASEVVGKTKVITKPR